MPYMSPGRNGGRITPHQHRPAGGTKRPAGLGDIVAQVLGWFGFRAKKGCGCEKRKKALNRLFPFSFKK